MTHTTTVLQDGTQGDHGYVIAEVDITSLESIGSEPFDAESELGLSTVYGADILNQENPIYRVAYKPSQDVIGVVENGGPNATVTEDVGSISGGDTATFTISLEPVSEGTPIAVSPPADINENLTVTANVTSPNVITVTVSNPTSGSIDPDSGDYTVAVVPVRPRVSLTNEDVGTVTLKFEGDWAP